MKKFLVIGNPINHSLSPKLQNFWIKNNKLDAIYGKLEAHENDLSELCKNLREGGLDGLNVTVPFKKAIIPKANLPKKSISGINIQGISRLTEALELL